MTGSALDERAGRGEQVGAADVGRRGRDVDAEHRAALGAGHQGAVAGAQGEREHLVVGQAGGEVGPGGAAVGRAVHAVAVGAGVEHVGVALVDGDRPGVAGQRGQGPGRAAVGRAEHAGAVAGVQPVRVARVDREHVHRPGQPGAALGPGRAEVGRDEQRRVAVGRVAADVDAVGVGRVEGDRPAARAERDGVCSQVVPLSVECRRRRSSRVVDVADAGDDVRVEGGDGDEAAVVQPAGHCCPDGPAVCALEELGGASA